MVNDDFIDRIRRMMDNIDRIFEDDISGGIMSPRSYSRYNSNSYTDEYMDIFTDDNKVYITLDLQHTPEEDFEVEIDEDHLIISLLVDKSLHNKSFKLPTKVNPKTMKKTYVRGILDISVEKSKSKELKKEEKE